METLIKKYYEFFLKGNFQDKESIHGNSEFNQLYSLILNAQDIKENEILDKDMKEYIKFFNQDDSRAIRIRYNGFIMDREKEKFEKQNTSFEWFIPPYFMMTTNQHKNAFIYSTFRHSNQWAKVYLSIKPQDYIKVTLKLQEFLQKLSNKYKDIGQYKFRTNTIANDSIVIRFSCQEHYQEFLSFLEENKEIYNTFDEPNPFLPKDEYGLSIITDNGGSYNYFVTRMIWNYMFECKEQNKQPTICDLVRFIQEFDTSTDKYIYENGDNVTADFKYVLISKLTNVSDQEIIVNLFHKNRKKYAKTQQ